MAEKVDLVQTVFHGRGGQGAVTAADLLCEFAFVAGYKDMISIPIIGAERRGAPIQAFTRYSKNDEIKLFCGVDHADYTVVFDFTLLDIPTVVSSIKSGILIVNAPDGANFDCISENLEIWTVDATSISMRNGLVISGFPILNTLMLGAYAKVTGHYSLETMKKVIEQKYGSKADKNYLGAKEAYDSVKKIREVRG